MKQGCPGEGSDTRTLGWLICPLQRLLSWKSDKEPKLRISRYGEAAYSVWPPYFVLNLPSQLLFAPSGRVLIINWRLFRIGWRYDRNWRGYIGPSAAFKKVNQPLLYY